MATTINKQLPLYIGYINPDPESKMQVDCVALVDKPAIDRLFIAFSDAAIDRFAFTEVNEELRTVVGAAMIPDILIYRNDKQLGEYNVMFEAPTIREVAEKFFKMGFAGSANIMHNPDLKIENITFFQSFIRDSAHGCVGLAGEYPEGTWFLGAKIEDDATWQLVKDGSIKGFSVEGLFGYGLKEDVQPTSEQVAIEQIQELLKEDDSLELLFKIEKILERKDN